MCSLEDAEATSFRQGPAASVHIILSGQNEHYLYFKQTLARRSAAGRRAKPELYCLRITLLVTVLACVLSSSDLHSLEQLLHEKSPDDIKGWYHIALEVTATSGRCVSLGEKVVPLLEQIAPGMFKVCDDESNLSMPCYPKFPSMYFNCHALDHQDMLSPAVQGNRNFIHLAADQANLEELCNNLAYCSAKSSLKIAVVGDSSAVHRFVCAYVGIFSSGRASCFACSLERIVIYAIPDGSNDLAWYLAQYDGLYKQRIYNAFVAPLSILPNFRASMDGSPSQRSQVPVPNDGLCGLLENYVGTADHPTAIQCYICECYAESHDSHKPDASIPFCMGLELGFFAIVAAVKSREDPGMSDEDAVLHASFRDAMTSTAEVQISYSCVSATASASPAFSSATAQPSVKSSNSARFGAIALRNMRPAPDSSATGSAGERLDPTAPGLEMTLKPMPANLPQKPKLMDANLLVQEVKNSAKQQVLNQLQEVQVTCKELGGRFGILVDSVVYGPFHHIKVAPLHVTLPVMSYIGIA
jgi:hypothetical protein